MAASICYVTFPNIATKFSGKGLDRYAYELVHGSSERLGKESVVSVSPSTTLTSYVIREMELVSRLRRVRAKIYHATSEYGLRALLIARKKPIVVSIHDLIPLYFFRSSPLKYANQLFHLRSARFADQTIVSSRFYGSLLTRTLGVSPERITAVQYGVDHSWFKPATERQLSDIATILFLGGLNPLKGIKDVIRAFEILSQRSTATLIIAGKGKATKSLKALAREKEVAHRTHFTGYVDEKDLPKLYNSADVLVWPSYLGEVFLGQNER